MWPYRLPGPPSPPQGAAVRSSRRTKISAEAAGPGDTVPAVKRSRALTGLIASRMAFGVAIWTLPGPVGKAFGVDITRDPLAIYLSRLMGARDVALAWELLATEGDTQRKWLIACMVCDAADTLAAIAAGRKGLSKRTTAMALGASLGPMVRGAFALREP